MKKRSFFIGVAASAVVGLATYNVMLSQKSFQRANLFLKDIAILANAEALSGEKSCSGGSCTLTYASGSSCSACCPAGKDPICNPEEGCYCLGEDCLD
ncbi:MAG: hypothetical protein LBJ17_03840 [Dysgonamonadaceae bacterium]|jgi:hypothetical protein|nr:hypothetical protein [Dysgonamonadaceae bacterium]